MDGNKDTILSKAIKSLHVSDTDIDKGTFAKPFNNTRSHSNKIRNLVLIDLEQQADSNKPPNSGEQVQSAPKVQEQAINVSVIKNALLTNKAPETINVADNAMNVKQPHRFTFLDFQNDKRQEEEEVLEEPVIRGVDQPPDKQVGPSKKKGKKDYVILDAAITAWKSATSHRGTEQKASLRYYHYKAELQAGTPPN
jgi:hypothetical protein